MSFLSNSSFGHKRPFAQLSAMRKRPAPLTEISTEEELNKTTFKKPFEIPAEDVESAASVEENEILPEISLERILNN